MHKLNDLLLWTKSIELAKEVYLTIKDFPKEERYGMTSQIQRCSCSIAANISEGAGRNSKKEFIHFLSIANGSSYELETFLIIACEVGYIDEESKERLLEKNNHIIRMNIKLQESIRKQI